MERFLNDLIMNGSTQTFFRKIFNPTHKVIRDPLQENLINQGFTMTTFLGIRKNGKGSWKEREVGKSEMKLERLKLESLSQSWTARAEVGKYN